MRPYQRFSLVVIFKSFENVPKLYFSLHHKISTFKPEDDIINIETGRNDNKKTLIINKMSTREEFMYIWLYRCYLKDEYAAYFLLATEVGFLMWELFKSAT